MAWPKICPRSYFFVQGVQYRFLSPAGDCRGQNHCTISTTPLQDTLNTVADGLHPDGGKIYLVGGVFHENIRLTKLGSDLILVGVDKGQPVVINGTFQIVDPKNAIMLQALTLNSNGGDIQLMANRVTLADSRIEAAGEYGGHVRILGNEAILTGTTINAGGTRSGGQINIGGSFKGRGPLPNADITVIDEATTIDAGSSEGEGGTVIVWGSKSLAFHGTINTLGGTGGFVEVSTSGTGIIDGIAFTGNMLVDPGDVCIGSTTNCSGFPSATRVDFSTILAVLNVGGTFTLNTDSYGTTGTGRVDFGGNANFIVNNNTGTSGTFIIHAADSIETHNVQFQSNGTTGTNYEFYAGSVSTAAPVASADIVQGAQNFATGGGHVIFDAADDISINDPLNTSGGDVTLIARGGDGTGTVTIGAFGVTSDDRIDTTDGVGGAGTVTIRTDGNLALNAIADPTIIANGGVVAFERLTTGNISAGDNNGGLHISQAEWDKISTETIYVGDGNTTNAYLDNLSATPVETIQSGTLLNVIGPISTTGNNDLTLQSDRIRIVGGVNVGTGIVTLVQMTSGTLINLGSTTDVAANTVELSDAEIDQITAGTLRIGSSDAGSITISDTISPAGTGTLSLITGDQVVDGHTINAADVEVANLALQAVNGIADSGDVLLETDIDTLAALNTTSGAISAVERSGGGNLIIGTVDGVVGAQNTANTGAAPVLGIQIETNNGNLTVNNNIVNARRNIFLVAQDSGSGDRVFTNNAVISAAANNGEVIIDANNMVLDGGTITAPAGVTVSNDLGGQNIDINLGGADAAGTLGLTDAELDTISTTGTLQIGNNSTGSIDVTAPIDLTDGPSIPTVALISGAAIGGSSGNVLAANTLNVTAGTDIGANGDPFVVNATELTTAGSGDQYLSEADSVTIGDNDLDAGTGNTIQLAGGTFLTTSSGGDIQNNTTVLSGATLAGTGTVNGTVTAQSGGAVAPGTSPGLINTGGTTFMAGSNFDVEVNGLTTAGTDYDQLNVSGSVIVNPAANLVTSGTIMSTTPGAEIVLINNDGVDAVSGNFAGLSAGASVSINGQAFRILYAGGDGNDVSLVENTAPSLTSFIRQTPSISLTNADALVFRATFSEEVQNVDAADFAVNGTTTATVTGVSPVSTSVYDVTISGGDLADFNGGVGLDLGGTQNIQDLAGNALPAGEPATDETYTLDNTAPSLTSFIRQTPSISLTNADALIFRATFSEEVQNVDVADFAVNGTTTATVTGVSPVSTSVYDVTVSGGDLADFNGGVGLDLGGTQNIQDLAGNALPAGEPATDETYTLDNTEITVTVNQATTQTDPTNTASIDFTATFDQAPTNFTAADVMLGGTASGVLSTTLSGGPTVYTVTITGMTGTGTITATIEAGAVTDLSGNGNTASTSTDNVVTFDPITPQAGNLTAIDVTTGGGVTYTFTVVYSDNLAIDTSSLDGNDIRVTGPGGFDQPATLLSVTPTTNGTPRTATYQIAAGFANNGTYVVTLQESQVRDTAGNTITEDTLGTFNVNISDAIFLPIVLRSSQAK